MYIKYSNMYIMLYILALTFLPYLFTTLVKLVLYKHEHKG